MTKESQDAVQVEEVNSKEVKTITPEDIKQAARDAVDYWKDELSEYACLEFWEHIRSIAIEEGKLDTPQNTAGAPVVINPPVASEAEKILPMKEAQADTFAEELVPYGKYVGQKVKTVLKKDKSGLKELATKPHLFQKQLLRYLTFVELKETTVIHKKSKPAARDEPVRKAAKSPVKSGKKK